MKSQNIKEKNYLGTALLLIMLVGLIVLFFYLDRQNQLSTLIRTWGAAGALLSILLMAALCMTPIPSEGLLILLLKIFGIYEGTILAWLGSLLSSLAIFYLARFLGQGLFKQLITPDRFDTVDYWIRNKGSLGLLIARLLPVPAFAVNYIAGVIPSVKLGPYVWTAAVSIIPYYVGAALVFIGVAQSTWIWLAVGGIIIFALWGISCSWSKREDNS
ncbi:MAG: VTT domain-containing protein [Syntrophomonas sp.]|nr:VTT domain-containing protein [Syntrophomonas sp.]